MLLERIWLSAGRRGKTHKAEDMHIGPVADDNVYRSIRLFETGVLNAEEADHVDPLIIAPPLPM